jgi:hypothetical protein
LQFLAALKHYLIWKHTINLTVNINQREGQASATALFSSAPSPPASPFRLAVFS